MDAVREFESDFLRIFPDARILAPAHIRVKRLAIRVIRKTRHLLPRLPYYREVPAGDATFQLSVQMGPDFGLVIPDFLIRGPNFIYMFDAWPRYMSWLADFADLFRVEAIFFSSRQSCAIFNQIRGRRRQCGQWLPEGIAPDQYFSFPVEQKTIDVLEFGRRHEAYHQGIREALARSGMRHYYARAATPLFSSKRELCEALAQTKICICFPSSLTHPARAENVSTMTLRYLQAMLSKCLVVGAAPDDITEVFGYDPVVAAERVDPDRQLLAILANFAQYREFIERNHLAVVEHHLWRHRIQSIRDRLVP
jgi:hypothetical protein